MKLTKSIIIVMGLIIAQLGYAAEIKVGVINDRQVLAFAASDKYQKLEDLHSMKFQVNEVKKLQKKVKQIRDQYQAQKDKLSFDEKKKVRDQLTKLENKIEHRKRALASHRESPEQKRKRLQKTWDDAIRKVAKKHKVNLILQKKNVYFAEKVVDLTTPVLQEVIKTLKHKKPMKKKNHKKVLQSA